MDLAIIGAGSAAFAAAIRATELGAKVVLIERGTVGGTCTNIGCIPSKALLATADTYHHARNHPFAGIPRLDGAAPDLAAVVAQKDGLVADRRQGKYFDLIDAYGLELQTGSARFVDADTVEVDGRPLRADHYLIAAGARPAVPPIEGLTDVDYLTSTTALELTELPPRLAVLGAGSVGLELGQAFTRLGAQVTFLDAAERIAPNEEPEVSETLAGVLAGDGIRIATDVTVKRVTQSAEGTISVDGDLGDVGDLLHADRLLVATGRAPNTGDLNLAAAGVDVDPGGFVLVDQHLHTSNPHVWAAGDITPSPQYVYLAAAQGALAAENALSEAGRRFDGRFIPRVTFTSPAIAAVGLTEAEASVAGHNVVTSPLPSAHVPRAIVDRDIRGLVKLVADRHTDRLLGVHLLANNAGEVIQAAVHALTAGFTTAQLADTWAPYLTIGEGLKLAAQAIRRDVTKLSCCAP